MLLYASTFEVGLSVCMVFFYYNNKCCARPIDQVSCTCRQLLVKFVALALAVAIGHVTWTWTMDQTMDMVTWPWPGRWPVALAWALAFALGPGLGLGLGLGPGLGPGLGQFGPISLSNPNLHNSKLSGHLSIGAK